MIYTSMENPHVFTSFSEGERLIAAQVNEYASSGDTPEMYRLLQKAVAYGLDDPKEITGKEAFGPYLAEKKMQKILESIKNGNQNKNKEL